METNIFQVVSCSVWNFLLSEHFVVNSGGLLQRGLSRGRSLPLGNSIASDSETVVISTPGLDYGHCFVPIGVSWKSADVRLAPYDKLRQGINCQWISPSQVRTERLECKNSNGLRLKNPKEISLLVDIGRETTVLLWRRSENCQWLRQWYLAEDRKNFIQTSVSFLYKFQNFVILSTFKDIILKNQSWRRSAGLSSKGKSEIHQFCDHNYCGISWCFVMI